MDTLSPAEVINGELRRNLRRKRQELAANVADCIDAADAKKRRAAEAAIRRNEKSIALLMRKLLCPHTKAHSSSMPINGTPTTIYRCDACTTTVTAK